ncbi:MAG: CxxxxCH/CxxCH domain-containing protein [Bacteroidetes bacterium]|nr:CxxxxCH/CxxCH domain-containing protein [Bacteroidota bacterium]
MRVAVSPGTCADVLCHSLGSTSGLGFTRASSPGWRSRSQSPRVRSGRCRLPIPSVRGTPVPVM